MSSGAPERPARHRPPLPLLLVATTAGTVHGLASAYWATGGRLLLWTLGADLVQMFNGRLWLLWPVAGVKLAAAILPTWWEWRGWPRARSFWRLVCAAGAVVLILWGGTNTVVAGAVLAGLVTPAGGYDQAAMIGHAWIWDPLFLLWGICLALALRRGAGAPKTTRAQLPTGRSRAV